MQMRNHKHLLAAIEHAKRGDARSTGRALSALRRWWPDASPGEPRYLLACIRERLARRAVDRLVKSWAPEIEDAALVSLRKSWRGKAKASRAASVLRPGNVSGNGRLLARFGGVCAYCDAPLSVRKMTVDHVVPKSAGGRRTLDNVVPACADCNQSKRSTPLDDFCAPDRAARIRELLAAART